MKVQEAIALVVSEIDNTFPDDFPPAETEILMQHEFEMGLQTEAIKELFSGKVWREISMYNLSMYRGDASAILTFLTPKAFCYYLPVFLKVSLTNTRESGLIPLSTLWRFSASDALDVQSIVESRVRVMSNRQLEVVADTARALSLINGPDENYSNAILDIHRILIAREYLSSSVVGVHSTVSVELHSRPVQMWDERAALIRTSEAVLRIGSRYTANQAEWLVARLRSRPYRIESMIDVGNSIYLLFYSLDEGGVGACLEAIFFEACCNRHWREFAHSKEVVKVVDVELGSFDESAGGRRALTMAFQQNGKTRTIELLHWGVGASITLLRDDLSRKRPPTIDSPLNLC